MRNKDNLKLGLVLGGLVPLAIIVLLYLVKFSYYPLPDFWALLKDESRLVTFFAAWSLVANIGLFTLFVNTRMDRTAKGVFIITVGYGAAFLLLRWLL